MTNVSGAPVSPSLYVQLLRDGGALPGDSKFYSTFTGPAVYTDTDKFQKLAFDKIGSGKDSHATKSDDGWIAMIQHYFVSAFVPPEKAPREIFTKKVDNLYAVGNILPLGTIAPGATVRLRVSGAPGQGLRVAVRNLEPVPAAAASTIPGAGAGLLGLRERVALAGGTPDVGPDGAGDFVVEARLTWPS